MANPARETAEIMQRIGDKLAVEIATSPALQAEVDSAIKADPDGGELLGLLYRTLSTLPPESS
jgi:hypothetical protein